MVLALLVLLMLIVDSCGIGAAQSVTTQHPSATATAATQIPSPLSPYERFVMMNRIQFGFDAQRSRYNPYESQLSPATVATLVQAWTAPASGAIDYSSPAVANGVVYVGS